MTPEENREYTQRHLQKAIRGMRRLEAYSCDCAAKGEPDAAEGNADFAEALGYLQIAKGRATMGCEKTAGIEPQFGGK